MLAAATRWTSQDPDPKARITGSQITIGAPDPHTGEYTISALVNSTYPVTEANVAVDAVCSDANGKVIGGYPQGT